MVDTVRTDAANLALLADNTAGDISAQDHRDTYVSLEVPAHLRYLDHRLSGETAHALDDFFTSDSSGDYTEVTASGTASWTYGTRDALSVKFANQSSVDWAASLKSIGALSAPVTIETRLTLAAQDANYVAAGIGFAGGVLSSSRWEGVLVGHGGAGIAVTITSSGTITNMDFATHVDVSAVNGGLYMRYVWETTNTFSWSISPNGIAWTAIGDADQSKTLTPTHAGFFVSTYGNAGASVASFDYLRVYESDLSTS